MENRNKKIKNKTKEKEKEKERRKKKKRTLQEWPKIDPKSQSHSDSVCSDHQFPFHKMIAVLLATPH